MNNPYDPRYQAWQWLGVCMSSIENMCAKMIENANELDQKELAQQIEVARSGFVPIRESINALPKPKLNEVRNGH